MFAIVILTIGLVNAMTWNDAWVFNTLVDTVHFDKTADFSVLPNGVLMATLPKNSLVYRSEIGDASEIGHFWYCLDPIMCQTVSVSA